MAKGSVNKVILIGNLGRDPEVRYTPNGLAVANVTLATTEIWKDKQTGENQERTEWHRIVFYGRNAEITGEYLRKGSKIYIEGRLQTRKWQDQNTGQERYTTEVIVDSMQMLGGKTGTADAMAPGFTDKGQETSATSTANHPPAASSNSNTALADDLNDDIPF